MKIIVKVEIKRRLLGSCDSNTVIISLLINDLLKLSFVSILLSRFDFEKKNCNC